MQCPVVFAISDNGVSISLKDKGYIHQLCSRVSMKKFTADGSNASEVHTQTQAAVQHARQSRRPVLLVSNGPLSRSNYPLSQLSYPH